MPPCILYQKFGHFDQVVMLAYLYIKVRIFSCFLLNVFCYSVKYWFVSFSIWPSLMPLLLLCVEFHLQIFDNLALKLFPFSISIVNSVFFIWSLISSLHLIASFLALTVFIASTTVTHVPMSVRIPSQWLIRKSIIVRTKIYKNEFGYEILIRDCNASSLRLNLSLPNDFQTSIICL